jgi:hypothetical protein
MFMAADVKEIHFAHKIRTAREQRFMFGRVGMQAPAKGWLAAGYPTQMDL